MDYIYRQVVKETDKAYMVEVAYDNKRDGSGLKYNWVAKSICGQVEECGLGKFVQVPTTAVPNGRW